MSDDDRSEARDAAVDAERSPAVAVTEHRALRDLEHVVAAPEHEARLDAVAVGERRPFFARIGERDHDVHALLVDAERRGTREARGLDPSHAARDGDVAAPALDRDGRPGLDVNGVGREEIDDHLERRRIANLHQQRARRDHARALLVNAQDAA